MKFIITDVEINEAIKKMGRLLTAKSAIPILAGVLVEAKKDCILFTASDGTESIVHRITLSQEDGAEIVEEGKAVFTKETFDVSKKMKGSITFETIDTNVIVSQKKTNLTFSMMNAEEYPDVVVPSTTKPLILSGQMFSNIVSKTTFSTAKSEVRPILQAVNMTFSKESNVFTATDSHRLSQVCTNSTGENEETLALAVPGSILDQALRIFDLSQDVVIVPNEQSIALGNGNTILYSRLLDGNYPDVSRLIPTEFEMDLVVNLEELIGGLELLQALNDNGVVNLSLDGLFVKLLAKGTGAKGIRELVYESYEGSEELNISFSSQYALDALKRIDSSSVRLRFNGSMKPFVIVPTDGKIENVQLILPVRQYD